MATRARSAISPDVLLKLWALSEPGIEADFILFAEAQDSDGVMLSVLGQQRHAQIIYACTRSLPANLRVARRDQCDGADRRDRMRALGVVPLWRHVRGARQLSSAIEKREPEPERLTAT
ncbi:hypothetical protein [Caballeronia calidae]|uniref:hypothetical protein n=1 Tax=Caballeronia calidae TaxID=1777139 RepID=UPI0018DFDB7F|nr:hypothetical protein [Caballeronia calidae]